MSIPRHLHEAILATTITPKALSYAGNVSRVVLCPRLTVAPPISAHMTLARMRARERAESDRETSKDDLSESGEAPGWPQFDTEQQQLFQAW